MAKVKADKIKASKAQRRNFRTPIPIAVNLRPNFMDQKPIME